MQLLHYIYRFFTGLIKTLYKSAIYLTIFLLLGLVALEYWIHIPTPFAQHNGVDAEVKIIDNNFKKVGNNWLRKNKYGFSEIYIEGNGYQRGQALGLLCQEILTARENAVFAHLKKELPSPYLLDIAKYPTAIINRNSNHYIPKEYQQEMLGLSEIKTNTYDYWASAYERTLYEQNLYEIGFSMNDLVNVNSSHLSAWGERTIDGNILVGHNQNFYMASKLYQEPALIFTQPQEGLRYVHWAWLGSLNVYAGMNEMGLVLTLQNQSVEDITSLKMPIGLLAKTILQYAKDTEMVLSIAEQYTIAHPVEFLISTAQDNTSYILYKDADTTLLRPTNTTSLVSSHSDYTEKRMQELLDSFPTLGFKDFAHILRNKEGLENTTLGYGYPNAINTLSEQLSSIFMPERKLLWVAAPPHQLGTYLAYDFNEFFNQFTTLDSSRMIGHEELAILPDSFAYIDTYKSFAQHEQLLHILQTYTTRIEKGYPAPANAQDWIMQLRSSNPDYYLVHEVIGDFRMAQAEQDATWFKSAVEAYEEALTKTLPSENVKIGIDSKLKYCQSRL